MKQRQSARLNDKRLGDCLTKEFRKILWSATLMHFGDILSVFGSKVIPKLWPIIFWQLFNTASLS